jgi:hypothetical protein
MKPTIVIWEKELALFSRRNLRMVLAVGANTPWKRVRLTLGSRHKLNRDFA